jgi:hypothetical protein
MKNQIGGTKSLSSRAYNQQFAGTFKKIRHLFNISPSFRETTVLKFDQLLYNEYPTSGKTAQSTYCFCKGKWLLLIQFFMKNYSLKLFLQIKNQKILFLSKEQTTFLKIVGSSRKFCTLTKS